MPSRLQEVYLGTFFLGHFSPQIAQKRLSPQTPPGRLLGISPTASARENRYFGHKSGSGALRNHRGQLLGRRKIWLKRPLRAPRPDFWDFGRQRLSPQVPRHTPHCQRARKPVFPAINRAHRLKIQIFLDHRLRNHHAQHLGLGKVG